MPVCFVNLLVEYLSSTKLIDNPFTTDLFPSMLCHTEPGIPLENITCTI